jgi:hypothetical protein
MNEERISGHRILPNKVGRACVCRQSRYWFFGQNLGDCPCEISKTQGAVLSVGKFPGEIQSQMGPWDCSEDVFGEHRFLVAE